MSSPEEAAKRLSRRTHDAGPSRPPKRFISSEEAAKRPPRRTHNAHPGIRRFPDSLFRGGDEKEKTEPSAWFTSLFVEPDVFEAPAVKQAVDHEDRKSTRLNSSHVAISYAVF